MTDTLVSTTTTTDRVGITQSITIPFVVERTEFKFPKSRTPISAYVHVANNDGIQLPRLSLTRADKTGIITGSILATAATAMGVFGWIIIAGGL